MSKIKKIIVVTLAVVLIFCVPLTASATTQKKDIYLKSEYGFTLESITIYTAGTLTNAGQIYANSYGNKDSFRISYPFGFKGTYYFAFKLRTNEDNYDGIEFDMEISDDYYRGQQYDECFRNYKATNGTNDYNWFTGWVGSNKLTGKVSDQDYNSPNSSTIVSKHYFINPPPDGSKCNVYDFAFGVNINTAEPFELTFTISNFKFNQRQYNEKVEANNSGNNSIDGLTGAMPDVNTDGVVSAFKKLTQSMIHNNTTCKIDFPGITIPKLNIKGIEFEQVELLGKREINFEEYFGYIPEKILKLVRALLTAGLIIYCFKELYSMLSFIFTVKGGGDSE